MLNSTQKHAQKSSAKREITIETSYERTEEEGEEIVIVRKIENLNVSRTLNFTFRQMNQEYHSLLHLVNLKIGYFDGNPGSMKEYELYEINDLIVELIIDPSLSDEAENEYIEALNLLASTILEEYGPEKIIDYLGIKRKLVMEIENSKDKTKYLRVIDETDPEGMSEYALRRKSVNIERDIRLVDGIIISVKKFSMKTDGVIVEALLGESNALDVYAIQLRTEKIREEMYRNDLTKAQIQKINVGIDIIKNLIENNQFEKAVTAYKEIFGMKESLKAISKVLGPQTIALEPKLTKT